MIDNNGDVINQFILLRITGSINGTSFVQDCFISLSSSNRSITIELSFFPFDLLLPFTLPLSFNDDFDGDVSDDD